MEKMRKSYEKARVFCIDKFQLEAILFSVISHFPSLRKDFFSYILPSPSSVVPHE
jgi:hypothetical protein